MARAFAASMKVAIIVARPSASRSTAFSRRMCRARQRGDASSMCRVLRRGRDAASVRSVISLTGQFAAVDGALTGEENLELFARPRGRRDERVAAHPPSRSERHSSGRDARHRKA